jgi:hypothetical protein
MTEYWPEQRWRLPSRKQTEAMLLSNSVEDRVLAAAVIWAKAVRLGFLCGVVFAAFIIALVLLLGGGGH